MNNMPSSTSTSSPLKSSSKAEARRAKIFPEVLPQEGKPSDSDIFEYDNT